MYCLFFIQIRIQFFWESLFYRFIGARGQVAPKAFGQVSFLNAPKYHYYHLLKETLKKIQKQSGELCLRVRPL